MGKPVGLYLPYNGLDSLGKKSRPLTAHQVALERYRKERVDYILDRRLQQHYSRSRARRERDGAILHAWRRCAAAPDGYDSEDEALAASHVPGSAQPNYQNGPLPEMLSLPAGFARSSSCYWDRDDIGEEAFAIAQTLRRAGRRLDRWDGRSSGFRAVRPTVRSAPHHFGSKASLLTSGGAAAAAVASAAAAAASSPSSSVGRRAAMKREDAGRRRNNESLPSSPRGGKKSGRRKEQRRIKHEGIEFAEPVVLQEKSLLQHQRSVDDVDDMDDVEMGDAAGALTAATTTTTITKANAAATADAIASVAQDADGVDGAAAAAAAAAARGVGDVDDTVNVKVDDDNELEVDGDERTEIFDEDGVDDAGDNRDVEDAEEETGEDNDDDETEEEEEEVEREREGEGEGEGEEDEDEMLQDGDGDGGVGGLALSERGDVSMADDG